VRLTVTSDVKVGPAEPRKARKIRAQDPNQQTQVLFGLGRGVMASKLAGLRRGSSTNVRRARSASSLPPGVSRGLSPETGMSA
jgi:hypothetical protein